MTNFRLLTLSMDMACVRSLDRKILSLSPSLEKSFR